MTGAQALPVLAVRSGGQIFGLDVTRIIHVLRSMAISPVPGAPATITGLINLRGHIVVAMDLRAILGQPQRPAGTPKGVILDFPAEPVCLLVDQIGDVIELAPGDCFETPRHIPDRWVTLAEGFYRQPHDVLIKLNEEALLLPKIAAA